MTGKLQGQISARQVAANLPADVRAVLLVGLSTATSTAITASDTVLSAFGKLQAQVNLKQDSSTLAATVRSTTLTGFSASPNSTVVAADTLLAAIGKLQAQVDSLSSRVTALGG